MYSTVEVDHRLQVEVMRTVHADPQSFHPDLKALKLEELSLPDCATCVKIFDFG